MKKIHHYFSLFALVFLVHCKTSRVLTVPVTHQTAVVTKQGLINCFEQGLTINGQPVWCEASAILYDGKKMMVANDKDMPDQRSSVFYWTFKNGFADTTQSPGYITNPVFKRVKKIEDFALSPDGKTVFLSTAFDRIKPDNKEWDAYNTILYWQTENENEPKILSGDAPDSTSVFLRSRISAALTSTEFPQGMPYFKIEGLAVTDHQLYMGIREEGKKFDDFKYKVKVITVPYAINNGIVSIGKECKVITDINISALEPSLQQPMGLSSIEYDHFNNRFLILTSFESGDKLGAYLWTATQRELENNKMNLVKDDQGNPLAFSNKSEDIAIINKRKIIIIHDDDRVKTTTSGQTRQPNQAAYSVVEFK